MSFILSCENNIETTYLHIHGAIKGFPKTGLFRSDIYKAHIFKTYHDIMEYIITEYGLINIAGNRLTFYIINIDDNKKYDFNLWNVFYFDLMSLCFKNSDSKYDDVYCHDEKLLKDLCQYKPKYILFDDDKKITFVNDKPDDVIMRLTGSSYVKVPSFELFE